MRTRPFVVFVAVLLLSAACKVRLLDDYDAASEESLLRTYGEIETLFDAVAELPDAERGYPRFAAKYGEIQRMIRVQVVREAARPLNSESHGIVAEIDTVFTGYRERHRTRGVDDTLLQRWRTNMQRMFTAALKAERVKRDEPD
jgi:hypothetical protein